MVKIHWFLWLRYGEGKELALRFVWYFSDMEAFLGHVIWTGVWNGYGAMVLWCNVNGMGS